MHSLPMRAASFSSFARSSGASCLHARSRIVPCLPSSCPEVRKSAWASSGKGHAAGGNGTDQREPGQALRGRRGDPLRDLAAHAVPHQREALRTRVIGNRQDVPGVALGAVAALRRSGVATPAQVGDDQAHVVAPASNSMSPSKTAPEVIQPCTRTTVCEPLPMIR